MTRETEIARYEECYRKPTYAMGEKRKVRAKEVLRGLPSHGSLLDVGAGRGELVAMAYKLGFSSAEGIEPVAYLASEHVHTGVATALPFEDESFDVVCCLDVLEHLVEEDIRPALREMYRVARDYLFLTASEKPSFFGSPDGADLHISKRPAKEWERMFKEEFGSAIIEPLGIVGVAPGWLITL
jgi:ubiquinone/menaquinone biosynthesis C-methylase UbiE